MRANRFTALAALLLGIIAIGGSQAASAAPTIQQAENQFDVMIADAKATMLVDPAQAVTRAQRAEAIARQLAGRRRVTGIATAQWLQGEAYLRLNDTARAAPLIDRAIALVATVGPPTKLNGDLLLSRGGLHTATAKLAAALDDYQKAHNIFRDLGEARSQAVSLLSIALLYQEATDYQATLKFYDQALDVYQGDPQILYAIYNNRAIALKELGRLDDAEVQLHKALALARTLKSPALEARVLSNIARGQLLSGQLEAADQTIREGLTVAQNEAGVVARDQFLVLSANSALKHGRVNAAVQFITRSLARVDPGKTTLDLREMHQVAYDIFRKSGDSKRALEQLEALKSLDDQTSKLAASANTSLAAARFDFANQKTRIAQLKQAELQRDIHDAKLRARTQQMIFAAAAAAAIVIVSMLAVGLVTIRRSRNEVRAANIDLGRTNDALGKALAAKTEFLATTSHEIRTPLNGILGMTQVMLADRTLSEPLRDRIGVVHGAGVTMRALVDDILDVAKMETGNLTIEQVPFDLKATLRDVSRMWEEQARAKGVDFTLDLDDCPSFIEGDPARLRQIAFNLLSNALKFTASGSVTVRASSSATPDGPLLTIAVTDSGIGIPADKFDIIFESFRQVDAGTTRQFGGTGLGLAICRNLARAMGGDVRVASEPGQGSTFTLSLPLVRIESPVATVIESAPPDVLLILDRNPISRSMLRAVLAARAGTIVFSGSVEEAAEQVAGGGIARILIDDLTIKAHDDIDVALATLTGTGAFTALLWPAPGESDHARFAAAGIDLVVSKPIAGAALAALLFDHRANDDLAPRHLVTHAA